MKHYRRVCKQYNELQAEQCTLIFQRNEAQNQLRRIRSLYPRTTSPQDLLKSSDVSLREYMAKLLGVETTDVHQLVNRLGSLTQGLIGRTLKIGTTYEDSVKAVCANLNLVQPKSFYDGEQAISTYCFKET